jgi:thioredoxin 1
MTITFIILAAVAAFAGYLVYNMRKIKNMPDVTSERIVKLTAQNFAQQTQKGIVLVDFWAAWCMPCKMLSPILNDVAESVNGNAKIAKLNIDEQQAIANKFSVRSIPTMIIFKNGKEIDRIVGVKTKVQLMQKLDMARMK